MPTFRRSLSRRTLLAVPALAALPAPLRVALADTWPSKAVHIVVPFAPGGSGDITARLVGKYMEDKTGQPFVVENKAGANGIVGVLSVKSSPPDGYTLMLATTSTNAANIHMYKNPGYDPEKDFQVAGVIGSSGTFLVVPADSPYKSMAELVAYAKANPGKLNLRLLQRDRRRCRRRCWARRPASNGRASPTRRSAMPGPTSMPARSSSCSST